MNAADWFVRVCDRKEGKQRRSIDGSQRLGQHWRAEGDRGRWTKRRSDSKKKVDEEGKNERRGTSEKRKKK
eukprot:6181505-Pleurochrysis_carterae.AAC.1